MAHDHNDAIEGEKFNYNCISLLLSLYKQKGEGEFKANWDEDETTQIVNVTVSLPNTCEVSHSTSLNLNLFVFF